jgi:hypothetical protein
VRLRATRNGLCYHFATGLGGVKWRAIVLNDFRFGSNATEMDYSSDFRLFPKSGSTADIAGGPFRARSGSRAMSIDQFVSRNENGLRHGEPHRLCGPRIDH